MTIEETLRRHDIMKIRFARDFNLSRPTFYEYMDKFNNNEKLPKEKYQIIFDSLFKEEMSHEDFMNRYNKLTDIYRRDLMMKIADLDPDNTDSIIRIVDELKLSVNNASGCSELIPFIEYISSYYANNKLVKELLLYFNLLNGFSDSIANLSEEDKWYLGNLYHINRKFIEGKTNSDSFFDEFLEKRNNLKVEKSAKKREIEKELRDTLSPYITEAIKNAPDGINNGEIIKRILEKINTNK